MESGKEAGAIAPGEWGAGAQPLGYMDVSKSPEVQVQLMYTR